MNAELLVDNNSIIGEGVIWDDRDNRLYWIDVIGDKIYSLDIKKNIYTEYETGRNIGFIGLRDSSNHIVGLEDGFHTVDLDTGEFTFIADPEANHLDYRLNDGKPGPDGRVWAGSMSKGLNTGKGDMTPDASLFCLDYDHSVKIVETGIIISNGITWSLDGKTMYYIDTPTQKVVAYDFEGKEGCISNKRDVIDVPKNMGTPDGMTIDSEDKLWICQWGGSCVQRWDPKTGKVIGRIELPVTQVACCCFGGEDMSSLFITTASVGLSQAEKEQQLFAGGLFVAEPGVSGIKGFRYKEAIA